MTASSPNGSIGRLLRAAYRSSAVRYLAVGSAAFVIDFGLLWLFHEVIGWRLWISTGVAFVLSFAFNYTLQRMFSFSSQASHTRSLAKYIALVVFNTFATIGIVALVDVLAGNWQIGKVVATICTTGWNYLAYRYIVFVDRPLAARIAAGSAPPIPADRESVAPPSEESR